MSNLNLNTVYPEYFQRHIRQKKSNNTSSKHTLQQGCLFDGQAKQPLLLAKALVVLSKIIRADFSPRPKPMYDPIVTVAEKQLRFEGFSACNSIYVRLDVFHEALSGNFFSQGTTHINFNDPILTALSTLQKEQKMHVRIAADAVSMQLHKRYFSEAKVKLSPRWLKALTEVQYELSQLDEKMQLDHLQSRQLWQVLPKKSAQSTLYLQQQRQGCQVTPIAPTAQKQKNSIALHALERLQLLQGLAPYIENIKFYQQQQHGSYALLLSFAHMQLTCLFSPSVLRGFSGEGQYLDGLLHDLPLDWVMQAQHNLQADSALAQNLKTENNWSDMQRQQLKTTLSTSGVLGFDLTEQADFYRHLPLQLQQILSLNPRLKHAQNLLNNHKILQLKQHEGRIEADVQGTEHLHHVFIHGQQVQCTYEWFQRHQQQRGLCQHILAVKIATRASEHA